MGKPEYREIDRMGNSRSPRRGARITNFLLHTQEGNGTAESLAGYLNNTNNGVSYHYTVRDGIVVDVVDTDYASWSVLDANPTTINLCFAGSRASWSREQWLAIAGDIRIAAWLAVQDAKKYGFPTDVIAPPYRRAAGISDHRYVTDVLGYGTHTDVGPAFPWDVFSAAVREFASGTTTSKEKAMSVADAELGKKFPSRSKYRKDDELVDTLAGFVLNIDARMHEEHVEREALRGVTWAVELVKREAGKGDESARALLAEIEGRKA